MSYILDALRKADAERGRDAARGIHAGVPVAPPARPRAFPVLAWGAAGAAVVAGVVAYLAWPSAPASGVAATPSAAGTVPLQPAPALAAQSAPATSVLPPPPLPVPSPAPAPRALAADPAAPVPAAVPVAVPAAAAASGNAPVAAGPAAATGGGILAYDELPPQVQRELPRLAISGGVHSPNPAQRMLVVGGQVVQEGAELTPGVVLEQIRPRDAVLRYRDWRYSVAY